jgi:hypothetical protein
MADAVSPLWVMQILATQLSGFLALLLLLSAAHKLAAPGRARGALRQLTGLPTAYGAAGLGAVCLSEAAAAILLLLPAARLAGAELAALVWGGYLLFMLRALRRGAVGIDCGCSFGRTHRALGGYQIVRNLVLLLLAAGVGLSAAVSPTVSAVGGGADLLLAQMLAALAMLAAYAAFDQVMTLQPPGAGALT